MAVVPSQRAGAGCGFRLAADTHRLILCWAYAPCLPT